MIPAVHGLKLVAKIISPLRLASWILCFGGGRSTKKNMERGSIDWYRAAYKKERRRAVKSCRVDTVHKKRYEYVSSVILYIHTFSWRLFIVIDCFYLYRYHPQEEKRWGRSVFNTFNYIFAVPQSISTAINKYFHMSIIEILIIFTLNHFSLLLIISLLCDQSSSTHHLTLSEKSYFLSSLYTSTFLFFSKSTLYLHSTCTYIPNFF